MHHLSFRITRVLTGGDLSACKCILDTMIFAIITFRCAGFLQRLKTAKKGTAYILTSLT